MYNFIIQLVFLVMVLRLIKTLTKEAQNVDLFHKFLEPALRNIETDIIHSVVVEKCIRKQHQ